MKQYPYLTTISATLLAITEALFGLLSLAFLFRFIFSLGILLGTLIKAFLTNRPDLVLQNLIGNLNSVNHLNIADPQLTQDIVSKIADTAGFDILRAILSVVIVFLPMFLIPVLSVLSGYSAISLRLRKKGANVIRFVHIVYAIINILEIFGVIFAVVAFLFLNKDLIYIFMDPRYARKIPATFYAVVICVTVIIVLILLMAFCYHKDVAQRMGYIASQIKERPKPFKKNFLTLLSLLAALFYLPLVIVLSAATEKQTVQTILMIFFGANGLRYLFVALANHGLVLSATNQHKITEPVES